MIWQCIVCQTCCFYGTCHKKVNEDRHRGVCSCTYFRPVRFPKYACTKLCERPSAKCYKCKSYKRTNLDIIPLYILPTRTWPVLPTTGGPMGLEIGTTLMHSSSGQCTNSWLSACSQGAAWTHPSATRYCKLCHTLRGTPFKLSISLARMPQPLGLLSCVCTIPSYHFDLLYVFHHTPIAVPLLCAYITLTTPICASIDCTHCTPIEHFMNCTVTVVTFW